LSRERFIDPSITRSEQVNALSPLARLLWVVVIATADDEGRRKASPFALKADWFVADQSSLQEIELWRNELAAQGLVRLYRDDDDEPVLDIPKWKVYQKPRYKKASRIPQFPGAGQIGVPHNTEAVQTCTDSVQTCTESPGTRVGEGRGGEGRGSVHGVLSHHSSKATSKATAVPDQPENLTSGEWEALLDLTRNWPEAGRTGGLDRLRSIANGGGPKDAERFVRMVDEAWKAGKLERPGKPGLPWAVLGKSRYEPPDPDDTAAPREEGQADDPERLRDIFAATKGGAA